jgi:hypothetical protein
MKPMLVSCNSHIRDVPSRVRVRDAYIAGRLRENSSGARGRTQTRTHIVLYIKLIDPACYC